MPPGGIRSRKGIRRGRSGIVPGMRVVRCCVSTTCNRGDRIWACGLLVPNAVGDLTDARRRAGNGLQRPIAGPLAGRCVDGGRDSCVADTQGDTQQHDSVAGLTVHSRNARSQWSPRAIGSAGR